jgi:phage protein D
VLQLAEVKADKAAVQAENFALAAQLAKAQQELKDWMASALERKNGTQLRMQQPSDGHPDALEMNNGEPERPGISGQHIVIQGEWAEWAEIGAPGEGDGE